MTTNTNLTRDQLVDLLLDMVSDNRQIIAGTTDAWFDAEIAADCIIAGEVTPDDNDGHITDAAESLAFGALMTDGPWWVRGTLVDCWSDDELGPATPEQIAAAAKTKTMTGCILIDADGDVVSEGSWAASQPGVRTVWVAAR